MQGNNQIGRGGAEPLADALRCMTQLQALDMVRFFEKVPRIERSADMKENFKGLEGGLQ
jgi:hypothetical protein